MGYIRQWLLKNAQLIAVVDLPADTFQPWTGTKTSIVIFRRREKPLETVDELQLDPAVFMSVSEHIGHDRRGTPIYNSDGKIKQDLSEIADAFKAFKKNKKFDKIHAGSFSLDPISILNSSDNRFNAAHYVPSGSNLLESFTNIQNKNFISVPLGDLVERVFCPGRFKRNYVESGGIPFLGGSNISQFSITSNKALSPNDEHLEDLTVKPNWILVTRSGSTGIVSRVPNAWDNYAISDHVIRIIPKQGFEDQAEYVETFLRSNWGQELLAMGIFGSVIDEITPDYISNLPIPIPKDVKKLKRVAEKSAIVTVARDTAASGLIDAQKELANLLGGLVLE